MRLTTTPTLILCAALAAAAAPIPFSSRAQAQTASQAEIGSLKTALELVRGGKSVEALATTAQFRDPAARKLVTWLALRIDWRNVGFEQANAFLRENADWPSTTGLIQRRAESLLYDEKRDARTVRAFFATRQPLSGEGKLALARALLAAGDRIGALPLVRSAWHEDELNASIEQEALAAFNGMLTRDDHLIRAARFSTIGDYTIAMRAAERAGADAVALEKARAATNRRASNANALIAAVPPALQNDGALVFARLKYRRRADDPAGAAQILLTAPREPKLLGDTNEWWREVRILVRDLLDRGDARTAYRIAVHAGTPERDNYKADQQFTAGWVALRFLKDHATAARHFARVADGSKHPATLSKAFYWQGRAAEAAGNHAEAKAAYERAARYTTAYYGQIARGQIGLNDLPLNRPVEPSPSDRAAFAQRDYVRALKLLYAADQPDLTIAFYNDLVERASDERTVLLLAAVAYDHRDARGMVLIGKAANERGMQLDTIAYPVFGIPDHPRDQPAADRALIYAIARQESQFTQSVTSSANAHGLMQVIPPTARAIARRIGIAYDPNKLKNDPVYNARLGANELGHLLEMFDGSYVLAFVGYNAGPGRAREWVARYGDPRGAKVDAVDWVERVPFSETRFYIQRVMENMQVYRVLFGDKPGFRIEADLRNGRG
jgi:soluble lytic murein transglycosylase